MRVKVFFEHWNKTRSDLVKGKVHPELKLFLIKAEQWEKHISEGLTKIRQRIQKLWIFKVLILWRHMRAALLYVVYCKFHKLPFSQKNNYYFTCAFDILSDTCFYTRLYEIDPFLHQEPWKGGNLWKLQYTTYGRAARKWRHKIKNLKIHNFVILWWIFVKPSLICFSHSSAFIKPNLISGWTSPLKM